MFLVLFLINNQQLYCNLLYNLIFSTTHHRLSAIEFSADSPEHISELKQMGIQIQPLPNGRSYLNVIFDMFYLFSFLLLLYSEIQLVHVASTAESVDDAENGLVFMQEMIEFMKNTKSSENSINQHFPLSVIPLVSLEKPIKFSVGSAQFGKQLHGTQGVIIQFYSKNFISYFIDTCLDFCSIICCPTVYCLFRNIFS